MSALIGRFGRGTAEVTVTRWQRDGDRISCGGWIVGASLANATQERDRLLGLKNNPDEPIVPFYWNSDLTQWGYCQVVDVSCPWDLALTLEQFRFQWSAELVEIAEGFAAVHEVLSKGAVRTNAHTIAAGDVRAFHCVPDAAKGYAPGLSGLGINTISTAVDEPADLIRRYDDGTPAAPEYFNTRKHWQVAPNAFYVGACAVLDGSEVDDDFGAATVVGRRFSNPGEAVTGWTITNGLVRVSPYETGDPGDWLFSWWDPNDTPAQWHDKIVQFGGTDVDFDTYPTYMQIVVNSPDMVSVRCGISSFAATSVDDAVTLDLTIRRGSRLVECYLKLDGVATSKWQIRNVPDEAGTGITGGRAANANDAEGDRYVLLCPVAFTDVPTGTGIAIDAAATTATFGVGLAVDGSSATDPWRTTDLRDEFYALVSQTNRISRS